MNDRYLLFLDVLGFTELVKTRGAEEVFETINGCIRAFERWEKLNGNFRLIYFSDSFILYQDPPGYGDWAFLDVYALTGMIVSALLAQGIAVRGAISYGEFHVGSSGAGRHQVYFGEALIEAYQAEQRENWIGVTILQSAWGPYEAKNPGLIKKFEQEHAWLMRKDSVLLLNPLIKLRGWYLEDLVGGITRPYLEWDQPEFPNDIRAFKFIHDQAQLFSEQGDFASPVAGKYHSTVAFFRNVLGAGMYQWAKKVAASA